MYCLLFSVYLLLAPCVCPLACGTLTNKMISTANLAKVLEKLRRKRVLSAAARDAIMTEVFAGQRSRSFGLWLGVASVAGFVALAAAAALFLAANWDAIPRLFRVGGAIVATLAALFAGEWLWRREHCQRLGSGAVLLSALLFGGCVAVISQSFHLGNSATGFACLWLAGALPLLLGYRLALLAVLAAVLGLVALVGVFTADFMQEPLIPLTLGALASYGVFLVGAGGLLRRTNESSGWNRVGQVFVVLGCVGLLLLLFIWGLRGSAEYLLLMPSQVLGHPTSIQVLMLGAIVGAVIAWSVHVLAAATMPRVSQRWRVAQAALSAAVIALPFVGGLVAKQLGTVGPVTETAFFVIANLLFILGALAMVAVGSGQGLPVLVHIGVVALAVLIFVRYIEFVWEALEGSAFFAVAGLGLIGITMLAERFHRRYFPKKK